MHSQGFRSRVVLGAFAVYNRLLSPLLHAISGLAGACRFQPSCSEYAAVAIERHGIVRGGGLALRRLSKCHPFHAAAYDPVPARKSVKSEKFIETRSSVAMHTSPPPVTIEEAGFSVVPSAVERTLTPTSPVVR